MILELIYYCCVTCTDITFSCASQKYRVWAETDSQHGHKAFAMNWGQAKPWKCLQKSQQSWLCGYMLWHTIQRVRTKKAIGWGGWNSLGWELLSSRCNRARQEPNLHVCKTCFFVPTRASWEGNCLQSPHSCVWNQIALQVLNASCFSSCMVISRGKIFVRRTDATVRTTKSRESLSGQLFSRLLTFMYKENSPEISKNMSMIAPWNMNKATFSVGRSKVTYFEVLILIFFTSSFIFLLSYLIPLEIPLLPQSLWTLLTG